MDAKINREALQAFRSCYNFGTVQTALSNRGNYESFNLVRRVKLNQSSEKGNTREIQAAFVVLDNKKYIYVLTKLTLAGSKSNYLFQVSVIP